MLTRCNNLHIINLLREDGTLTESKEKVADIMVAYFQNLYRQSSHYAPLNLTDIAPFIDKRLERDQ